MVGKVEDVRAGDLDCAECKAQVDGCVLHALAGSPAQSGWFWPYLGHTGEGTSQALHVCLCSTGGTLHWAWTFYWTWVIRHGSFIDMGHWA
eukprot:364589-Chlamydomonas_euryale.AAC.6